MIPVAHALAPARAAAIPACVALAAVTIACHVMIHAVPIAIAGVFVPQTTAPAVHHVTPQINHQVFNHAAYHADHQTNAHGAAASHSVPKIAFLAVATVTLTRQRRKSCSIDLSICLRNGVMMAGFWVMDARSLSVKILTPHGGDQTLAPVLPIKSTKSSLLSITQTSNHHAVVHGRMTI
jgi:hypothetical protein